MFAFCREVQNFVSVCEELQFLLMQGELSLQTRKASSSFPQRTCSTTWTFSRVKGRVVELPSPNSQ